jgi:hypothetical protein
VKEKVRTFPPWSGYGLNEPLSGHHQISESLLLRDAVYLLQGISGKYINFASSDQEDDKITFADSVCAPL